MGSIVLWQCWQVTISVWAARSSRLVGFSFGTDPLALSNGGTFLGASSDSPSMRSSSQTPRLTGLVRSGADVIRMMAAELITPP